MNTYWQKYLYTYLCKKIDQILKLSGIHNICIKCSTKKRYKYCDKEYTFGYNKLGCCNDCKYQTQNGCSTISIWCKLWLCSSKLYSKIYDKQLWERLEQITIRQNYKEYRYGIEDNFK